MDLPQGVARGLLRLGSRNHAARWQAWRVGDLLCAAAMMARAPAVRLALCRAGLLHPVALAACASLAARLRRMDPQPGLLSPISVPRCLLGAPCSGDSSLWACCGWPAGAPVLVLCSFPAQTCRMCSCRACMSRLEEVVLSQLSAAQLCVRVVDRENAEFLVPRRDLQRLREHRAWGFFDSFEPIE